MAAAPPPKWPTLPPELLQRCISHLSGDRDRRLAALACCRAWGRAVLTEKNARLQVDVDREEAFAPSAKVLQALLGDEQTSSNVFTLDLYSDESLTYTSPERCLAQLRAASVPLTCVTRLSLWVSPRAARSSTVASMAHAGVQECRN